MSGSPKLIRTIAGNLTYAPGTVLDAAPAKQGSLAVGIMVYDSTKNRLTFIDGDGSKMKLRFVLLGQSPVALTSGSGADAAAIASAGPLVSTY